MFWNRSIFLYSSCLFQSGLLGLWLQLNLAVQTVGTKGARLVSEQASPASMEMAWVKHSSRNVLVTESVSFSKKGKLLEMWVELADSTPRFCTVFSKSQMLVKVFHLFIIDLLPYRLKLYIPSVRFKLLSLALTLK